MKLNKAELKELRELYGGFKLSQGAYQEIGKQFGVSWRIIKYYLNKKFRENTLRATEKWRKKNPEKVKENNRRYYYAHKN